VVGVDGFVTDDSGIGSGAWSGSTVSSRTIPEPGLVRGRRDGFVTDDSGIGSGAWSGSTVSSPTIPEPPR